MILDYILDLSIFVLIIGIPQLALIFNKPEESFQFNFTFK